MTSTYSSESCAVDLAGGQIYRFHGAAGDRIRIHYGAVRLIDPPVWLAERMIFDRYTLGEGDCRSLGRRGWFRVEALTDTRLLLDVGPSLLAELRRITNRLVCRGTPKRKTREAVQ